MKRLTTHYTWRIKLNLVLDIAKRLNAEDMSLLISRVKLISHAYIDALYPLLDLEPILTCQRLVSPFVDSKGNNLAVGI